jgi:hypothetical protein
MSSPSIVPNVGGDVYVILDDLGKLGRVIGKSTSKRPHAKMSSAI